VTEDADDRWIFHLALADEWREAVAAGAYERSTLGRSLAEQGFIHGSFARQVQAIADLLYRHRSDVVLLRIDPAKVGPEIRIENLEGGDDRFPHVYGPLAVDAVVRADPVELDADGRLRLEHLLAG
jgi:glutathione S-transferase